MYLIADLLTAHLTSRREQAHSISSFQGISSLCFSTSWARCVCSSMAKGASFYWRSPTSSLWVGDDKRKTRFQYVPALIHFMFYSPSQQPAWLTHSNMRSNTRLKSPWVDISIRSHNYIINNNKSYNKSFILYHSYWLWFSDQTLTVVNIFSMLTIYISIPNSWTWTCLCIFHFIILLLLIMKTTYLKVSVLLPVPGIQ